MKITALQPTKLLKKPVQANTLPEGEQIDIKKDVTYELKSISKNGSYSKVVLPYEQGEWFIFNKHWYVEVIDRDTVYQVYENLKNQANLGTITKQLNNCLFRFNITTFKRLSHFLSQTAHESMGLFYEFEAGSDFYLNYLEGREDLGNLVPGDGLKYRGVDAIQLTGKANYNAFSKYVGDPRVMEGYLYVKDNYKFLPSGWFWDKNKLNTLCDKDATVEQITKVINGGYNGLDDRKKRYNQVRRILTID